MSASRRPGAGRRSRLSGRGTPPPPLERADTTPLDVPRPDTRPLHVPGDDNPTDVVPPFPPAVGAPPYPSAAPPYSPGPTWQQPPAPNGAPWGGGQQWAGNPQWAPGSEWPNNGTPPASRYGPPNGYGPPAGYGPPGGYGPQDAYGPPGGYAPQGGYGPPEGYGPPAGGWPPGAGQVPAQLPPGAGQVPPPVADAGSIPPKVTVTRVAVARSRQLTAAAAERVRTASRADGAGESGLTHLLWVNALHMAGDAMIAVSLAGTLFFAAAADAQRGNVALYLLVTMAPFALLAPVIGPALDRLQRGRRWAIAVSHFGRCALALVMAAHYDDFWLYPAALGVLVLSKAHNVLRAAVVPRVLPGAMSLTSANARLSVFGLATAGVAGAIGAGIAWALGFEWLLYATAVVFATVGGLSLRLPAHVDVPAGEMPADIFTTGEIPVPGRRRRPVSPHVVLALRANAALRGLGGFLTIFAAFLVQAEFPGGWGATLALGAIAAAAGIGSFAGTAIGSRLHTADPDRIVLIAAGAAAGITVVAAFFFSFPMAVVVALVASITNALGKVSLDAVIQREVPESLRASAFARSETVLQLAWVVGGAFGIALPPIGWLGFTVAASLLVLAVGLVLWSLHRSHRPAPPSAPAEPPFPEPVWTADTDSPTDPLGQRWS